MRQDLKEGSVEQKYEPTNRNWINRRQGWTSWHEITKSIFTKGRKRKFSGCVLKVSKRNRLTPGGLYRCLIVGTGGIERRRITVQESAEGIVGHGKMAEGPNGREGK